ncbi:hypothetical protein FQN57_003684 [Myotisia sp. PD_48]|nr:hypothetical protein FQN57_003684 [Myotisia sp. PD_48]
MTHVALITGGASGMGFAVAEALVALGNWKVHIVDLNAERGAEAAAKLGNGSTFHQGNVTCYDTLGSIFESVFKTDGRLDFVFANAGVVERFNFYAKQESGGTSPPPIPDHTTLEVDLKSVFNTAYLALHYFRLSGSKVKLPNLVMTASCAGIYSSESSPLYSAAKHGVLGLVHSISGPFYEEDNIRVNAICPGPVWTNLVESSLWSRFPKEFFTPLEQIGDIVSTLVTGGELVDSKGQKISEADRNNWGNAIEMSGKSYYFRRRPEFSDKVMEEIVGATKLRSEQGKRMRDGN